MFVLGVISHLRNCLTQNAPPRRLPAVKIIPASYAESAGTTETLAAYLATNATWKLGVAQSLPWPRCVQHVTGEPAMVDAVAQTVGAIRCGRSAIQDPGFAAALIQGVSSPSPVLP